MNAKRRRIRFHFWLDINKEHESEVADTIAELKRERAFTSALRDGILIIADLRRGKVDKLLEIYPWLKDAIGKPKGEPDSSGGDEIAMLKEKMYQLERLIIAGNQSPAMVAKTMQEPAFVIEKDHSQDAAKNLLGAMSGLM